MAYALIGETKKGELFTAYEHGSTAPMLQREPGGKVKEVTSFDVDPQRTIMVHLDPKTATVGKIEEHKDGKVSEPSAAIIAGKLWQTGGPIAGMVVDPHAFKNAEPVLKQSQDFLRDANWGKSAGFVDAPKGRASPAPAKTHG